MLHSIHGSLSPYQLMPYKLPFETTIKKTKHKQSEGLGRFNVGVPRGFSNL
jgi:hypothetical protein